MILQQKDDFKFNGRNRRPPLDRVNAMLSFALNIAEERGLDFCLLTTDDYRLPAIKNYLVGGFRPVIYEDPDSNMRERWLAVAEKLGFGELDFIEE